MNKLAYLFLFFFGFVSCNGSSQQQAHNDSVDVNNSNVRPHVADSSLRDSEKDQTPEILHISKADSAKAADSVKRSKNPIRDFN